MGQGKCRAEMSEKDYEAYAIRLLPKFYETSDYPHVFRALREKDPTFRKVSDDTFGFEFLSLKLALACRIWDKACEENEVKDEAEKKALLRVIMNSFQSPKFVKIAEAFSDYLHSENADAKPWIALPAHFFKRLKVSGVDKKKWKEDISEAFQFLVGLSEGFKNSFENQFFEFANSIE